MFNLRRVYARLVLGEIILCGSVKVGVKVNLSEILRGLKKG